MPADRIISKPRKFLHDLLILVGLGAGGMAFIAFHNDGNFVGPGLIAAISFFLSTQIKWKWDHKASLYK